MSVLNKLQLLIDAMDDFNAAIVAKLSSIRGSAITADSADALNNRSPIDIVNEATSDQNVHIADKSNPHAITPDLLNAMPKAAFDSAIAAQLPTRMSGLSFIAGPSFLDPFTTDKDDSANLQDNAQFQLNVESDGTIVLLRNACVDGANGVFYSYALNGIGGQMGPLIHTNVPLVVPILGSRKIESIVAAGDSSQPGSAFIVRLLNPDGSSGTDLALLAMSANSIAPNQLQCWKMPSGIIDLNSSAVWKVIKFNNTVVLVKIESDGNLPVAVSKFYNADLVSAPANYTTPLVFDQILNCTYTRSQYSDTVTTTNGSLRLFDTLRSDSADDKPLFLMESNIDLEIPNGLRGVSISHSAQNRTVRLLIHIPFRLTTQLLTSAVYEGHVTVGIMLTPTSGTGSLQSMDTLPCQISFLGDFSVNGVSGKTSPPTRNTGTTVYGRKLYQRSVRGYQYGVVTSAGYSKAEYCISTRLRNNDGAVIPVALLATGISQYSTFQTHSRPTVTNVIGALPKPVAFTQGSVLVNSLDSVGGSSLSLMTLDVTVNETHDTLDLGSISGFQNNATRVVLDDPLKSVIATCINGADVNAVTSRFITGLTDSRSAFLDANGDYSGSVFEMTYEKQVELSEAIAATVPPDGNFYSDFLLDMTVPDLPDTPAFGLAVSVDELNQTVRVIHFTCQLDFDTVNIVGWHSISAGNVSIFADAFFAEGEDRIQSLGGVAKAGIYAPVSTWQTEGKICVNYALAYTPRTTEGHRSFCARFTIDDVTGALEFGVTSTNPAFSGNNRLNVPMAIPRYGFGFLDNIDKGTVAILKLISDSPDDFIESNGEPPEFVADVYVTGQTVHKGAFAYMNEALPVFLGGVSGYAPAKAFNLATMANGAHYLYLNVVNGVFSYELSGTILEPTNTKMYLGKVNIASSKLDFSQLRRVYRLGRFNLAASAEHFSIPVSLGYHDEQGNKLNWH